MDEHERDDQKRRPDTDEYEALNDPRQVMLEVVALVEDLHRATTKLGDAIASAGLPAREWRGPDCRLLLLADQFPDITLDALITRLAEFAADTGPHWLHSDRGDIAHFNDEVSILYGVIRPLRIVAQRLRMVPARERGDLPLEKALGDARIGTPLDRVAALLRDLESLGPFISPLALDEWSLLAPVPSPEPDPAPVPVASPTPTHYVAGVPLAPPPNPSDSMPSDAPSPRPAASSAQPFRRLRDYLPPPDERRSAVRAQGRDWSWLRADASAQARTLIAWLKPRKWLVLGVSVMLLALGLALLSLVRQSMPSTTIPPSSLAVSPAQIALTCSGKSDTVKLMLRDTGAQTLTWSITTPPGMSLSATHGTLKPGASAAITLKVTSQKATSGTLTFASNDGSATVVYVVSCA